MMAVRLERRVLKDHPSRLCVRWRGRSPVYTRLWAILGPMPELTAAKARRGFWAICGVVPTPLTVAADYFGAVTPPVPEEPAPIAHVRRASLPTEGLPTIWHCTDHLALISTAVVTLELGLWPIIAEVAREIVVAGVG